MRYSPAPNRPVNSSSCGGAGGQGGHSGAGPMASQLPHTRASSRSLRAGRPSRSTHHNHTCDPVQQEWDVDLTEKSQQEPLTLARGGQLPSASTAAHIHPGGLQGRRVGGHASVLCSQHLLSTVMKHHHTLHCPSQHLISSFSWPFVPCRFDPIPLSYQTKLASPWGPRDCVAHTAPHAIPAPSPAL